MNDLPRPAVAPLPDLSQRGFTLTELAIVLGVIGTMLSGVWLASGTVNNNRKLSLAVTELQSISQNIRAINAGRSSFSSIGTTRTDITITLGNAGIFPLEMTSTGSTYPQNPWGGEVHVWTPPGAPDPHNVATGGKSDNTEFEIDFYPNDAVSDNAADKTIPCGNLMTRTVGSSQDAGLYGMKDSSDGWIAFPDPPTYLDSPSFVGCGGTVGWAFHLQN